MSPGGYVQCSGTDNEYVLPYNRLYIYLSIIQYVRFPKRYKLNEKSLQR